MSDILINKIRDVQEPLPTHVNYVQQGEGAPVILVHGIAASLHDWDELMPDLAANHYAAYALDLLGHGESAKPDSRTYHIDWLLDHFANWINSLELTQPLALIGHSLGGYLVLEYARCFPERTRGLILSNPYYRLGQLSPFLRLSYRRPALNSIIVERTPQWLWRFIIDATNLSLGRTAGVMYNLPEKMRMQTALDYKRTAPGVYHLPNTITDLSPYLQEIGFPTLVVWGDRDLTLDPGSFQPLIEALPRAEGKCIPGAGHVLHQANTKEFNQLVLDYLRRL